MKNRKNLGLLLLFPVLAAWAIFVTFSSSSSTAGASPGPDCDIPIDDALLPDELMPTGGPYIDPEPLLDKALAIAHGYGVPDPQVLELRFTTYCEAMLRNGMPLGTYVNRYREVYEISVQHFGGDMIIPRNPDLIAGPFRHSFYIFDANDGFPLTWGADGDDTSPDSGVGNSGTGDPGADDPRTL